ncbi:MAG: TRAP transporter substrate-binding protein [Planctomycetota bacterium]|jgi:TRAP-type C4-dicarboxylate transport system substrate-binding protein|nr:TRAP transporter substrate-binding protein [Planctomycetota bacterium]
MKRFGLKVAALITTVLLTCQFIGAGEYTRTVPLKLSLAKLGNDGPYDNQRPAAHYLMDLMKEYSNGMITFDFYPGGQLGNESDMLDQVISGDLDMATLSDGNFMAITPVVGMTLLPFLFESSKEFYDVASLEKGTAFQKAMVESADKKGLFKYIAPMNGLFRGFSNRKHPVTKLSDLADLNIRIQPGTIYTDTYKALGGSTATIAFAELYTSLQQGSVDAEDNSHPFHYAYKFYELEGFTTELRMFFQTINLIVSNDCWEDKFTGEDRAIFMRAATEAQKRGFQDQYKMDKEVLELIGKTNTKLTLYETLTKKNLEEFRKAVTPVWEKHSKIDPNVWNLLQAELKAYRK